MNDWDSRREDPGMIRCVPDARHGALCPWGTVYAPLVLPSTLDLPLRRAGTSSHAIGCAKTLNVLLDEDSSAL